MPLVFKDKPELSNIPTEDLMPLISQGEAAAIIDELSNDVAELCGMGWLIATNRIPLNMFAEVVNEIIDRRGISRDALLTMWEEAGEALGEDVR